MATPVEQTTPPQAAATPENPMQGFDATRPFRFAWRFVKGTVSGTLNSTATFGRWGFFGGLAAGALMSVSYGMAQAGFMLILGPFAGLAIGAVGGMVIGAVTGGISRVMRGAQIEEEEERMAARGQRRRRDPYDAYRDRDRVADFNFAQMFQQENQDERDYSHYWRDQVKDVHQHEGVARGM